ncbi:kelch-like protein 15 isoform X4 [Columba livia]|uniref:kelch-like protein 15 isoform X4 n=1 Tax=Columba livia TaxID=8932 RepID=UPI0031BADAF4
MQPGLPQRLLRVRRRRQRGVRMRGAGRGGGSAPRACACRRVTVVAERGLRSSSLAVCRRDLKIIFRLSLPQTANSKMTVRLYIVQIYWTLFLKLWKFGFLSETFDIQE